MRNISNFVEKSTASVKTAAAAERRQSRKKTAPPLRARHPRHNSAIRSKKQRHRLSAAGRFCGKSPPRLVSTQKKPLPPREQNAAHLSFFRILRRKAAERRQSPRFSPPRGKAGIFCFIKAPYILPCCYMPFPPGIFPHCALSLQAQFRQGQARRRPP